MMNTSTRLRRFQVLLLVGILSISILVSNRSHATQRFTDVAEDFWAYDAVEYAVNNGFFAGTSETTFSPHSPMTRAMLWVVLARMDGVDTSKSNGGAWYQTGLDWSVRTGISDGTNPNNQITRQQFATMLYRYFQYKGIQASVDKNALVKFADRSDVASYATDALCWATTNGIVTGTSPTTISPNGNATRAQVATMLMRYDKTFNGGSSKPETPTEATSFTITLNGVKNNTMKVGDTTTVSYSMNPAQPGMSFVCKSSNPSVATVTDTGWLEAKSAGTTTITMTASNGQTASVVLIVTGGSSTPSTPETNPGGNKDDFTQAKQTILDLTNKMRTDKGLSALEVNDFLMKAAQIRAEECAKLKQMTHIRPDGSFGTSIMDDYFDGKIYDYAENAGLTPYGLNADLVTSGWKASRGHYGTITNSHFQYTGVGIALDEDGACYYVQLFLALQ